MKTRRWMAWLAAIGMAGEASAETLYNGIALPAQWPPRLADFPNDPVAPPYLASPPAVIPIDVGRQLFVDDFLIESTTLKRAFHAPEYHAASPILKPDKRTFACTTSWGGNRRDVGRR